MVDTGPCVGGESGACAELPQEAVRVQVAVGAQRVYEALKVTLPAVGLILPISAIL